MEECPQSVPECRCHLLCRGVPLTRPPSQGPETDSSQYFRDVSIDLAWRPDFGPYDLIQEFSLSLATERAHPGQEFVEDDAEAEDVRSPIDPIALSSCLLGAHVGRRSHQPRSRTEILVTQGHAEVGQEGFPPVGR